MEDGDDGYTRFMSSLSNDSSPSNEKIEMQGLEAAKKDAENFALWRAETRRREYFFMIERVLIVARVFVNDLEENSSEC